MEDVEAGRTQRDTVRLGFRQVAVDEFGGIHWEFAVHRLRPEADLHAVKPKTFGKGNRLDFTGLMEVPIRYPDFQFRAAPPLKKNGTGGTSGRRAEKGSAWDHATIYITWGLLRAAAPRAGSCSGSMCR